MVAAETLGQAKRPELHHLVAGDPTSAADRAARRRQRVEGRRRGLARVAGRSIEQGGRFRLVGLERTGNRGQRALDPFALAPHELAKALAVVLAGETSDPAPTRRRPPGPPSRARGGAARRSSGSTLSSLSALSALSACRAPSRRGAVVRSSVSVSMHGRRPPRAPAARTVSARRGTSRGMWWALRHGISRSCLGGSTQRPVHIPRAPDASLGGSGARHFIEWVPRVTGTVTRDEECEDKSEVKSSNRPQLSDSERLSKRLRNRAARASGSSRWAPWEARPRSRRSAGTCRPPGAPCRTP